ncbi:MAG: tetratricopeptide repeat protein [Lacipirellulaceae bacterium]
MPAPPAATEAPPTAPVGVMLRARAWAAGHPKRSMAIGLAFVGAMVATVVAWVMLADIAAGPPPVTIEMALEALDAGDNELAESLVEQMQTQNLILPGEYGGPLFVLGAIKCAAADLQWAPERKRTEFFVASKYLSEARAIGWPRDRDSQGLFLLGKSLIWSRQTRRGMETLDSALEIGTPDEIDAHLLLAEAYYYAGVPNYSKSIEHLDLALDHPAIDDKRRGPALLLRAKALANRRRWDEAEASITASEGAVEASDRLVTLGKVLVARLEASVDSDDAAQNAERARNALDRAKTFDKLAEISREADYLLARIEQLTGDEAKALGEFVALRREFGATTPGVAAAIAEGDLLLASGDSDDAVEAYRRGLEVAGEPSDYRSDVLPLAEFRKRVRLAHSTLIEAEDYAAAYHLAERVTPMLSRVTQLRLRANTLAAWGEHLVTSTEGFAADEMRLRRMGRRRLRDAGVASEELALARFAHREYGDLLWQSADAFYRGNSYSSAIRILERYLRAEPVQRNALALLRLGQSHAALGATAPALAAYEECLEFHPDDTSSYRASFECARAHRIAGNTKRAEELLRANLRGSSMTPESPEWRDSLFELGRLLIDEGRYEDGLNALDEAVSRYPEVTATRMARYRMADAHRRLAVGPLERLTAAKTVNEKERARAEAYSHLEAALGLYALVRDEVLLANSGDLRDRVLLRNCYMLGGATLFDLGRYEEAIREYSDVSTLYQNEPFVLEPLVQISHCWRRRRDPVRAAGAIMQAKGLLSRLPADADFATSTTLSRAEWVQLLDELERFHTRASRNRSTPPARAASVPETPTTR